MNQPAPYIVPAVPGSAVVSTLIEGEVEVWPVLAWKVTYDKYIGRDGYSPIVEPMVTTDGFLSTCEDGTVHAPDQAVKVTDGWLEVQPLRTYTPEAATE